MTRESGAEIKITLLPTGQEITPRPGQRILETARENGLHITSVCGGKGTCGKCRVLIEGPVDDPLPVEKVHLSQEDLARGVRLACQTRPRTGQVVRALHAEGGRARILKGGKGRKVVLAPQVRKVCVSVPPASSLDGAADWERVLSGLSGEPLRLDLAPLRQLPGALKESPQTVTLAVHGDRLASVEAGDTSHHLYGLAFDIGTTTVVGYLMDLRTGKELAAASGLNPQGAYGGDLISRLTFVLENPDGLAILQREIVSFLNQLIGEVADEAGIIRSNIYEVTIVGNVVMHHLLLGISPISLATAPYAPVVRESLDLSASEVGLELVPQARVHMLPNIAGFVGADMVGTLLTALPHQSSEIMLIIDLGTNGEIALGSRDRLLVCSTAAGPAFEGARIRHGMRASTGAIDRVRFDGDVHCRVVHGGLPQGICGSGLIDAVAQMVERGIVYPSGRLLKPGELPPGVGTRLRGRIVGGGSEGDARRFILAHPAEAEHLHSLGAGQAISEGVGQAISIEAGQPGSVGVGLKPAPTSEEQTEISITQQDIRELQLAKGAIYAGIEVLKKELGIEDKDIAQVLLAGAFGTYVNPASARAIGLIPPVPLERVQAIGNSAGFGAQLALLSTVERKIAGLIARQVEHVRLSGRPDFQHHFMQALRFPAPGEHSLRDSRVTLLDAPGRT